MKILLPVLFGLLLFNNHPAAQVTAKPLKKVVTLAMPGETGSNGASVVWHPVQKKYYAAFAGNATFPFAVFDINGKRLSGENLESMLDVRGMWYNSVTKRIEANGYGNKGWVIYVLDPKGLPLSTLPLQEGQVQPDEQSAGVFDAIKKRISFLHEGTIYSYSLKGEAMEEAVQLKKMAAAAEPASGELEGSSGSGEEYNATALCYTGIPNAEFAILNLVDMQIELYNRKGVMTKAYKVPGDVDLYSSFNFAYANGIWWLFDKEQRSWLGFR